MTNLKKRERAKTNASLISMVQRFSDITIMFAGLWLVCEVSGLSFLYMHLLVALITLVVFQMLGGITVISNGLATIKSAPIITMVLMSLITFFAGMLLGSGNASWYAFGPLVPNVTAQMGVPAATVALPMQLSAAIGRCMSPVAGVVIALSGMAGLEITDIVRRCAVPAVVMFACNMIVSYIVVML